MHRLTPQILRATFAWTTLAVLSACGGGGGGGDAAPQPAAQSITFAAPAGQTFGVAPAALSASASSGLAVTFTSTTPGVCTVSGTTLTLVGVGSCTVSASQAGNASFQAATTVSNTFAVAIGTQTISFISPGNQALGTAPGALVATATSGLPVTLTSSTASVCTVSGTTLTLVSAGSCSLAASQAGNGLYAAASPVSFTVTVAPAPLAAQAITFASPGNQTWGTTPAALSATSSSGLAVSFASTTPAVCTVSGTSLALVTAGSCSVTASQGGNTSFAAATMVAQTFIVAPAAQTINFVSPGNQNLGTTPGALVATASSGLAVTLSSTTPGVCTVSGTTLTLVSAGTCTVTANQAGSATYAAATAVSQSITVAAALQAQTITVTFSAPSSPTVGVPTPALAATASSGLPVSFASTTPSVCGVSGTTLTLLAAGTCNVLASQAGNSTFAAAASVQISLTVAAPAGVNAFANLGFETAPNGAGEFADGWQGSNAFNATRSSAVARTGSFSANLAVPDNPSAGAGSGLFQNSVDHGGLAPVSASNWGTSPTLTFWVKGNVSVTGNLNYALRYLNSNGNILNTSSAGARTIWTGNSVRDWTQITLAGVVIPTGTTAVFLEMTLATGPTGPAVPCGVDNQTGAQLFCNWGTASVYLDDVSLLLLQ